MKRIAVLTTSGGMFPLLIQAVYDKGLLTFGDVERLPAPRDQLQDTAKKKLPRLVKRGDTVIVDEYSGELARLCGAKCINLSMKGADDIPVIVKAFSLFWEMKRQHAILLPANNPGAYEISSTMVNEVHNQKGEISYQVDWENIRAEQYLTLLSVYATSFNDVGSAEYIRQMMGAKEDPKVPHSPLLKIVQHQQAEAEAGVDQGMAGMKIDENSWIL